MDNFISTQMEYFKHKHQGYTEKLFLKIYETRLIIELHMVKLDSDQ